MPRRLTILPLFCFLLTLSNPTDANWPRWRGPNDNGLVEGNPPVEWSETKNIKWKVAIPGLGHATPIVWGNRIYVQTAEQTGEEGLLSDATYRMKLLALDRKSGETLWEKTVYEGPPAGDMHDTNSQASTSGLTDGGHIYAYFGSYGIHCFDLDGKAKWTKDLGDMNTFMSFGEGSAPAVHGNTLIVNWDHEGDSFIVALDKRTGKELWRQIRDEGTSWSTPLVVSYGGGNQVIITATNKTRSYDLQSGKQVWECAGLGRNVIPMPIHKDGVVYVSSGYRHPAMQAIQLSKAKGDITGSDAILWSITENTPYVSSPLLTNGRLYFVKSRNSILSCYDAKTGEIIFGPERLEGMGNIYASLVGVKNRIYISDLDGNTLVIKNGPTLETLALNALDNGIAASPVIVGDDLYIRSHRHLYRIAKD